MKVLAALKLIRMNSFDRTDYFRTSVKLSCYKRNRLQLKYSRPSGTARQLKTDTGKIISYHTLLPFIPYGSR